MHQRKALLVVLSLVATAIAGRADAQTRDQNLAQCGKAWKGEASEWDATIAACTAIIQSGAETTESIATIFHNRGGAYWYKGLGNGNNALFDLAIRDFTQEINLKPDGYGGFALRGRVYISKGQYDLAIQDEDKAIALRPDLFFLYIARGDSYIAQGQYDRALQNFDQMAQAVPRTVGYVFNLRCKTNAIAGRFEAALADCNKSGDAKPDRYDGYEGLGFLYLKMGDAGKALTAYNAALKVRSDQFSLYGRGRAELMLNEPTAAKADMDAARRIHSGIDEIFVRIYRFPPVL